ncbi:hypothetical protein ACFSFY_00150 [Sporosarcina siberiensis]|uniref:Uncharacterized protein n=1 Tax=Sporosarcina siberiensis TaxID=1365606 RepID=A0ABW4SAJ0_9BACL
MLFSKKSFVYFLAITLLFSLVANVYVFSKRSKINEKLTEQLGNYVIEIKDIKEENTDLNKRILLTKNPKDLEDISEVTESEKIEDSLINEIDSTVKRFVEYSFNTNPDNYVDRKKLANNYMTDNLFETIYTADGVEENAQKVKLETEKVEVFINNESDEVIVFYTLEKELIQSGFKETVQNYIKVEVVKEDNVLKVSKIEPLVMTEGGY